ncbi:MAG: hypothetical protein AAFO68_06095, partial [Pseudomonadota bacterium]
AEFKPTHHVNSHLTHQILRRVRENKNLRHLTYCFCYLYSLSGIAPLFPGLGTVTCVSGAEYVACSGLSSRKSLLALLVGTRLRV